MKKKSKPSPRAKTPRPVGPTPTPAVPTPPRQIIGLTRLAALISGRFQIPCSKQQIKHWQKHNPPFPSNKANYAFEVAACFEWVEKYYISKLKPENAADLMVQAAMAEARTKIRKDEESEYDFKIKRGEYILRSVAERTIIGAIRRYHALVRSLAERVNVDARLEKLRELGLAPEPIAAFRAFDLQLGKTFVDEIEAACARYARAPEEEFPPVPADTAT